MGLPPCGRPLLSGPSPWPRPAAPCSCRTPPAATRWHDAPPSAPASLPRHTAWATPWRSPGESTFDQQFVAHCAPCAEVAPAEPVACLPLPIPCSALPLLAPARHAGSTRTSDPGVVAGNDGDGLTAGSARRSFLHVEWPAASSCSHTTPVACMRACVRDCTDSSGEQSAGAAQAALM